MKRVRFRAVLGVLGFGQEQVALGKIMVVKVFKNTCYQGCGEKILAIRLEPDILIPCQFHPIFDDYIGGNVYLMADFAMLDTFLTIAIILLHTS